MTALRAVLRVPGLVAAIWLGHVATAALLGAVMHAGAEAALRPYTASPDGHAFFALVEVLNKDRSLIVTALGGAFALSVVSFVGWTLASPFVIARLAGRSLADAAALATAALPAVLMQTVWHHLLRLALFALVVVIAGPLPAPLKLGLLALALGGSAVGLDLVRTQVTLHGAQRLHVRSAWFALVRTFRDPRRLATGAGLVAAQGLMALGTLWLGINAVGPGSWQWLVRGLALLGVIFGFWRIALSATGGPVSLIRGGDTPQASDLEGETAVG